jgi:hypothetical protein
MEDQSGGKEGSKEARKHYKAVVVISHGTYWTGNKMQREMKRDN